jgi:Tol biopolymer transport system component
MRRGFGSFDRFGRRQRVGLIGTVVLVAGLAAGPGMFTARSAAPPGAIERVSVPDGAAATDRDARPDSGSSLACSALNSRRCTKRTLSDDGTKVVYSSAAGNLVDGDSNGRTDVFLTTINPGKPPTPPSAGSGGSPADPGVAPSVASTVRISVGPGGEGNGDSLGASISPDGKWIAFESSASNLVGGDANGPAVDVFVYNVDSKALTLASVPAAGGGADGPSYSASVANSGAVSFTSNAGNLVAGASGQQVYARSAGQTILVSAATSGAGDGKSGESTISGDGTKVAFMSDAANIGSGGAPGADVFIATLGTTSSVMMLTSGAAAYLPSISADGQQVVFLADGYDNDGIGDIYRSSSQGGAKPTIYANCPCRSGGDVAPVWATIGSGGAILYSSSAPFSRSNRYLDAQVFEHNPGQAIVSVRGDVVANGPAEWPSVSADGALVAFESTADNLVDGDTNAASDVFLAQMGDAGSGVEARRMTRVSVYATGDARRGADSFAPAPGAPSAVSADGNLVAFASDSTNLVPGDTNSATDIFVRNRHNGKTERVSVTGSGGQADGASIAPAMSADGRYVVFASAATNLVGGDTNGVLDIYVRDRRTKETRRISEKPGVGQSPLPAEHPAISPNGAFVAFDSAGEFSGVAQSGSGRPNVFRFRMDNGAIDMVSTMMPEGAGEPRRAGYKASWSPSVADDGSVAFLSDQTGMTASNADDPVGAIPNWTDVYVGRIDGTLIKASMNADPQPVPAIGDSYDPQISADGTKVVFVVGGKSNMPKTSGDQNPGTDVLLRDLSANTTVQVNVPASGKNRRPAVNRDGSVVAFTSDAANLVGGDSNGLADVFVAKMSGGPSLTRVVGSGEPDGFGAMPSLSLDGHTVAFGSRASNLVGGDGNGAYDWFALSDAAVPCLTCTADGVADGPIGSVPPPTSKAAGPGYRFVAADGGIFSFDQPFNGSAGGTKLAKPIVGMAATPSNNGYWLVASDGGIFSYGDAAFWGSTGAIKLAQPIVGMTATPSGKGYWFVASDGGIFAFGDAAFYGSMGGKRLAQPIVGMASSASGKGYWLVAADGGIFSFGDAAFYGSTGAIKLNKPIVGMDRSASGKGYRFVASDGGIFSFGDAKFLGSTGAMKLNKPVVGMARARIGDGYWLVASDGGIFSYGSAGFHGSTGAMKLAQPIVGMAS